ncbi:MAG: hypothetical protein ACI9UT_003011 [Flavobacteriales bacterium]|jgi:hypothetical protein
MRKTIYVGLSLITLLIGACLGNIYAILHSKGTLKEHKASELHIQKSDSRIINNPADRLERRADDSQETNLPENLVRAISNDNSTQQAILIYQSLSKMSQQDLVPLIASIDSFENISADDKSLIFIMLLARMAEISPAFSIELSIESLNTLALPVNKQVVMNSIFTIWSKNAPAEVFKYISTQIQYRSDYLALLFRHWSAKDFPQALLAAKELQKNSVEAFYGMVNGSNTSGHFSQLLPIIWAEQDEELKKLFFRRWAAVDAISVAEWLANNTKIGEAKKQKEAIFSALIRRDFNYAIDWYFANTNDSFSNPEFSGSNFYDFITPSQYSQVFDWLLLQDLANFKTGVNWIKRIEYNVSVNAVKYDIDIVKRYLSYLIDISRKWELSLFVYKALAKQNVKNAKAFLEETGLTSDTRFISQVEAIDLQLNTPCIGYCY